MQLSSYLTAFVCAALSGLAFGADGASVGTVIVSATLIGAAVLLTARRASGDHLDWAWLDDLRHHFAKARANGVMPVSTHCGH